MACFINHYRQLDSGQLYIVQNAKVKTLQTNKPALPPKPASIKKAISNLAMERSCFSALNLNSRLDKLSKFFRMPVCATFL